MARKYQATFDIDLATPSDPNEKVFSTHIDLATALSQRLQRNVRQGHVYNIHKVECQIQAPASGNFDQGVAVSGELLFCPATRNSVKAWQHAYGVWKRQKKLALGAIGPMVRYDDFEVAWSENHAAEENRISTLYAQGNADENDEAVVIYGFSNDGSHVSLEDIYESAQPQPDTSRFPISNQRVKQSKFTQEFPYWNSVPLTAHWSASHVEGASFDTGPTVSNGVAYVTDGGSLAGVCYLSAKMLPENTLGHIQDELIMTVTVTYSLGASLLPRRRKSKKGGKKSYGRKSKRTYRKRS